MKGFAYVGDGLFQVACALYAANRWLVKPHVAADFLHSYFNDLLLIPCALPLMLALHRKLGLRPHDAPPTPAEIALHLIVWSILCEFAGPRWMPGTTGDLWDIGAYLAGGVFAGIWWNRHRLRLPLPI